jgi:dipeptidyl aminopeptidase/acylaminoacyl peptidase
MSRLTPVLALFLAAIAGCDSASSGDARVVEGVDFDVLFAPATATEIAAVDADWAARGPSQAPLTVVDRDTIPVAPFVLSELFVVSQSVEGTHYAAVAVPLGATGPLPVFLYTHAGDQGVNVDETIPLLSLGVDEVVDRFVFVAPSFRGETLTSEGNAYVSTGSPSPLDRDVDDVLGLLEALPELVPLADTSRIGVLGFSRGAGVALLLGARRPSIDAIAAFFGPTDFFGSYVQDIVADALRGERRDLPGFDHLNATYLQPLKQGMVSMAVVRDQLVRRSPVLFAQRLPRLQLHHGTADAVVDVSQAEALIDAMGALGRVPPAFAFYLYPGAGHSPLEMDGSFDRVVDFFAPLATP